VKRYGAMNRKKIFIANMTAMLIVLSGVLPAGSPVWAQEEIPRIVNVSPQFGAADVDTTTDIVITFSGVMDKKLVEKSFAIFPPIDGQFRWQENTLIFKPGKPLLPSTVYLISFTPEIKSAAGIPLAVMCFTTPSQAVCVGVGGTLTLISIKGEENKLNVAGNNPVWAVDNQHILYDYQGKIWMVDKNGRTAGPLTEEGESYAASRPVNNPQGDLVAFAGTDSAGIANVYCLEMKTKAVRQLTGFFEPGAVEYLQWSPDGLYLAFLRGEQVWIMNQDGTNMRKLTTTDLPCKANFAWSPGGTKIAFSGKDNVWIGDVYSGGGDKLRCLAIAESDGAGLVEEQDIYVTGRFHSAT